MLCVAIIALWVRSCWYADFGWVRFHDRDSTLSRQLNLKVGSGGFQFESYTLALLRYRFPEDREYVHWDSARDDLEFGRWMRFTLVANADILGFPDPWPGYFRNESAFGPRLRFHRDNASDNVFVNSSNGIIVPFWIPTMLLGLLPIFVVFRFWRGRRRKFAASVIPAATISGQRLVVAPSAEHPSIQSPCKLKKP